MTISICALKIHAKQLKIELGIKHQQALDHASVSAGYQSYHHARKELLKKPHSLIFGIDIKDFMEMRSLLPEYGLSEEYNYWLKCHNAAAKKIGSGVQSWTEQNDWIAVSGQPTHIKTVKGAIDFIRNVFFHPPLFVLFDGLLVELDSFVADDYVRFSFPEELPPDDHDTDYFLTFLQEDYDL